MEQDYLPQLDSQACFALYVCAREMTKLYRPFLDEIGITYTQYVTLLALWENDRIPVKTLGERLYLDSGTLTPLLKKLETMKLIIRERDKVDERSVLVRLTDEGHAFKERVLSIPERVFCQTNTSLEDLNLLREQLRKLTQCIHQGSNG